MDQRCMEGTRPNFVVVGVEATWVEKERYERASRMIHAPNNPIETTQVSYKTRLVLYL